ncbi:hypothetical protein ANN_00792 [Periplaneta americana]|uniref:Uncharacterized protein n=1 Tax=Periplaneta americana TaxID=6978 RepID=A0ABQ8TSV0_PERAM|nr:hypothetical protein ANN_00792 [Periplaneta americana]
MAGLCEGGNQPSGSLKAIWEVNILGREERRIIAVEPIAEVSFQAYPEVGRSEAFYPTQLQDKREMRPLYLVPQQLSFSPFLPTIFTSPEQDYFKCSQLKPRQLPCVALHRLLYMGPPHPLPQAQLARDLRDDILAGHILCALNRSANESNTIYPIMQVYEPLVKS